MKNILSMCRSNINSALREINKAYDTFNEALEDAKAEGYENGFKEAIISQGKFIEMNGKEAPLLSELKEDLSRKYERKKAEWIKKISTFRKRHNDYLYALESEWWRREYAQKRSYRKPTDPDVIICAEAIRALGEEETWLTKEAKIEPWVLKMGCTYATDPEEFKEKVYEYIGVQEI